ncbi:hypothetical protein SETIT_2G141500v2 [Setaria italica]|uniref:Uncharacterized protein n=2 Tax=Setaria TaxID=4554 RepID=K3ZYN6_SETIT|nr:uncharacterized protein LOC101755886 [Setaria italica]XP_034582421.1 uncharacterized protein LOC117845481 [Setaria viridis]RCV10847.1 hypothetical protein SETIT_2G141500v2 [Setaria italica]TKW32088.1 hypothetical protein SEVIR_2G147100v2 [Setaria viridis]
MSTNNTNAGSPATSQDAAADGADKQQQQQQDTVKKTVQTVEVRSSAGQPDEEGVLKPVRVVHEIPAKDAKENPGVKQD